MEDYSHITHEEDERVAAGEVQPRGGGGDSDYPWRGQGGAGGGWHPLAPPSSLEMVLV